MAGDKTWGWRRGFLSGSDPQTVLGAAAPSTPGARRVAGLAWPYQPLPPRSTQREEKRPCLPSQKLSLT